MVSITDEYMDFSQLLGPRARTEPQVFAYKYIFIGLCQDVYMYVCVYEYSWQQTIVDFRPDVL